MTRMSARLLVLLLLLLAIACAKSDDEVIPPEPIGEAGVANIVLVASSLQLPSASREADKVSITAYARDELNRGVSGVPFSFNVSNDGFWEPVSELVTDSNGTVQILLSTPTNRANRDITVTATADGISNNIVISVTGTTLTISGPSSVMIDDSATLEVTLRDSAGNGIPNARIAPPNPLLTFTSAAGNNITPVSTTTNSSGRATISVAATAWMPAGQNDTITVSGFGTSALHTFGITADSLVFTAPAPETEVVINVAEPVTVEWRMDGALAPDGSTICFTTTLGTFNGSGDSYIDATTTNGRATVNISSANSGRPTITATTGSCGTPAGGSLQAKREILFIATVAASLDLQANPTVIGIGEQSNLVAVVRDPNDNLVKNKSVVFSVATDYTGGVIAPSPVITDEYGRAEATYTAGATGSGRDDVIVRASVTGLAPAETTITVGGKALYITLGTGNTIEVPDDQRYAKPYSVMVTDSSGHSVGGVQVALALWPTYYHKGSYTLGDSAWSQNITAAYCPNEDINRDGQYDPILDYNNNTQLDPGGVATIRKQLDGGAVYTVTTDDDGFADFYIVYLKQFALWAEIELTASTLVQGTESTRRVYFTLPILAADLTNVNASPPGQPSPFGTANNCFDPS